jgi:uncharacterized protein (TIGR02646 family)
MRSIRKFPQPPLLTQWRAPRMLANRPPGMDCNYRELRRSPDVLKAVEDGLLAEQGGICAYTGHRISITPMARGRRDVDFHIEHLTAQDYCTEQSGGYGKDSDYQNIVACWPRPNCGFEPAYGAKRKYNWPQPEHAALFISPLRPNCSSRFRFNHRGEIAPAYSNDEAAEATITNLGLCHETLTELRRFAIRGALNPSERRIKLSAARKLLRTMQHANQTLNHGERTTLMPFCFAVEPALRREIRKLEGIMAQG